MTIAELFINLGVKGADTAGKAIKGVKEGMSGVASTSLEAKAAIFGAMYALQHFMSHSMQAGTNLANFGSLTGLSTKQLQQWQYAATGAGVAAEEVTGSVKSVQSAMASLAMGEGPIKGMAMVANTVGIDKNRQQDTFYMLGQLQKFAQAKQVPAEIGNQMLKSFGLSENVIAAMRRNAFDPKILAHAPVYNEGEISRLNKIDAAWGHLGHKIEMAIGHLNAKHGLQLIHDIDKLTTNVLKLVDALLVLSEKLKILDKASTGVDAINRVYNADQIQKDIKKEGGGMALLKGALRFREESKNATKGFFSSIFGDKNSETIAPTTPTLAGGGGTQVEVNQQLNFQHDGRDAKKTSDSVKQAAKESYRQFAAQAGGY